MGHKEDVAREKVRGQHLGLTPARVEEPTTSVLKRTYSIGPKRILEALGVDVPEDARIEASASVFNVTITVTIRNYDPSV